MAYNTKTYRFNGSHALADEIVHLAIRNDLRVSNRSSTGIFRVEHFMEVFGPSDVFERFEREMESAKNRLS
jgi:hypothetical protein